uniref:Uncharacterized protein n=1 Tax=Geospiza parvula TaxID=87175 RepID=A0A8C3N4R2_GEOPR
MSAAECLVHPWIKPLSRKQALSRSRSSINMRNFRRFNARRKWKVPGPGVPAPLSPLGSPPDLGRDPHLGPPPSLSPCSSPTTPCPPATACAASGGRMRSCAAVRATQRRRGAPRPPCCAGGEAAAPELLPKKAGSPREEPWGAPIAPSEGAGARPAPSSVVLGVSGTSAPRSCPRVLPSSLLCPNEKNKCHLLLLQPLLLLLPLRGGSCQPGRC